ncbi:hypothetical protein [Actinomadura terrae]|uniref:hypothetical protein n=1 Tax=Actinomadura terrae TaxID=604353 RepID=UPI001FA745F4|nr:hypothetical protein [Actinomadura terrae]
MRTLGKLTTTALIALTAAGLTATTAAAAPDPGTRRHDPSPSRTHLAKPDPRLTAQTKKAGTAAAFTQANCYRDVNDNAILPWYGAPVSASQPVAVSASEGTFGQEFIGDAHIYPENVQVVNSAVFVRVHTGWGAPLNICLHYVG